MAELAVGATIWRFDENRRKYTKAPKGNIWGELIYREHWTEVKIIGENRRSWLCGYSDHVFWKAPKVGPHPGWAFSEQEVDDDCYVKEYRSKIASAITSCGDPDTLRKIAALIGWKPKL